MSETIIIKEQSHLISPCGWRWEPGQSSRSAILDHDDGSDTLQLVLIGLYVRFSMALDQNGLGEELPR